MKASELSLSSRDEVDLRRVKWLTTIRKFETKIV
jgi:hypothetical protein